MLERELKLKAQRSIRTIYSSSRNVCRVQSLEKEITELKEKIAIKTASRQSVHKRVPSTSVGFGASVNQTRMTPRRCAKTPRHRSHRHRQRQLHIHQLHIRCVRWLVSAIRNCSKAAPSPTCRMSADLNTTLAARSSLSRCRRSSSASRRRMSNRARLCRSDE